MQREQITERAITDDTVKQFGVQQTLAHHVSLMTKAMGVFESGISNENTLMMASAFGELKRSLNAMNRIVNDPKREKEINDLSVD